jgi:Ca2+-binding EF-hand superfamily protein
MAPDLNNADRSFLKKYYVLPIYSNPMSHQVVKAQDFMINKDIITLEDRLLGVFDLEDNHEIINVQPAATELTKARTGDYASMSSYQNFLLSEKNTQYKRIAYTFLDVLGYTGGILEIGGIAIAIIIIPFKYNLTKIRLLMDYLPQDYKKVQTTSLTFQYFIYDMARYTRLTCLKRLITADFYFMKDSMDSISSRFLEITNQTSNKMVGGVDLEYDSDGNIVDVIEGEGIDPFEIAEQVQLIWEKYDDDGNGYLDKDECKRFLKDYNEEHPDFNINLENPVRFDRVFEHIDVSGDGRVDKQEMSLFIKILMHMEKSKDFNILAENAVQVQEIVLAAA